MSEAKRLGIAGWVTTAVTFGPARNGFGLFLPFIREEFVLSTAVLGLIASGLYAGYLLAVAAVGLLAATTGARLPVIVGLASAAVGMGLVAAAPNAVVLTTGVVLAGTAAGWSWAPFNDVAEQLPRRSRDGVLSAVSTGTTFGILAAGLLALAAGGRWRAAWVAFAVAAVAAVVPNVRALPGRPLGDAGQRRAISGLLRGDAVPLFVVALSFGVVSAFYFSFAVDLVVRAGGLSRAVAGPVLYVVIGAAGSVGMATGTGVARYGLGSVLTATLASLAVASALLGVAPGFLPGTLVSAALLGAGVMIMSALLSIWSSSVFPDQPSAGFSAALVAFGVGLTIGPAALGALADAVGLPAAFLVSAAIVLPTMLARPGDGLADA